MVHAWACTMHVPKKCKYIPKTLTVCTYANICTKKKCKYQHQNVCMDISKKNETKSMNKIAIRVSNTVNG